jgi:hypothetical protein
MKCHKFQRDFGKMLLQKEGRFQMKKLILSAAIIGLFLCISPTHAALVTPKLLLPDILSDQTGTYTYTAGDGRLSFTAKPITITFDGLTLTNIGGDNRFYRADLIVDSSGNWVSGIIGDDLAIVGDVAEGGPSGTLLTGEIIKFGFFDVPGRSALFDFVFRVTGGELADEFGGIGTIGGDFVTAEDSNFLANLGEADGGWDVNHSGRKVKHDTAPVIPIPSTVLLFGAGLFALMGIRRRFQNK